MSVRRSSVDGRLETGTLASDWFVNESPGDAANESREIDLQHWIEL